MEKELQKVLFLDLDGTIITTQSGETFPLHSNDWKLIPDILPLIDLYYSQGYKIAIVTNQGGISLGYFTEKVFISKINNVCKAIEKLLNLKKNSIVYSYTKAMTGYDRKPNPAMAFDILSDYELTLKDSIMVGDMASDGEFAINAGISTFIHSDSIVEYMMSLENIK